MVKSMTGYGEGESTNGTVSVEVAISTKNYDHLDIRVHGLNRHKRLKNEVQHFLTPLFNRGRLDVQVELSSLSGEGVMLPDPDDLSTYYRRLQNILSEAGIDQTPTLSHLIALEAFDGTISQEDIWPLVKDSLDTAAESLVQSRKREGQALADQLMDHLKNIDNYSRQISDRVPQVVEQYRERLKNRIDELVRPEVSLDENRLEQEVAMVADKLDIEEEITRIQTHVDNAQETLRSEGSIGKKLDFLGKELQREANTVGAKCKDGDLQTLTVDMKLEIEKFKEQVRNIE